MADTFGECQEIIGLGRSSVIENNQPHYCKQTRNVQLMGRKNDEQLLFVLACAKVVCVGLPATRLSCWYDRQQDAVTVGLSSRNAA